MSDITNLDQVTKEKLILEYEKLCHIEEETVATKMTIREELMERISDDGEIIAGYSVTKANVVNVKTSIEDARALDAVKTKEVVDTTKLGKLFKAGVKIPDIEVTKRLTIRKIKEQTE